MRIVWFGSYARGSGYPRSGTLVAGLRELGHDVAEVHAPLLGGADDRVGAARSGGTAALALRQAGAAWRLARGWFRAGDHDAVVVGYGGLADVPIARFLQNFDRRPLAWDAFVPLYDAAVRDRGLAAPDSARARLLLRLERASARMADVVLTDTCANGDLLAADLGAPRAKFATVGISQPDPGEPAPLPESPELRVLLVATHIPLHGVPVAIEAMRRLRGGGVSLRVVGTGQGVGDALRAAAGVPGVTIEDRFAPEDEVRAMYAASHVGLGIFGATEKAARVVPLKAALTAAAGRVLVTRDSAPARDVLGGDAVLVPPDDPEALARALEELRDDRARVVRLAAASRRRYAAAFTPRAAATALLAALAGATTPRAHAG